MSALIKFNQSFLIAGFLTLSSASVLAEPLTAVPNTFAAGDTIIADEMNENFTAIVDGITNIALTPGPQGAAGIQGVPGATGADGSSCTVTQNTGSASIECPTGTIATVYDGADGSSVSGNTQGDMQYWDGTDWVLVPAPSITGEATLKFVNGSPSWTYTPVVYSIGGMGPAGGIVFYITDGGAHGLEAAPTDQTSATWGCSGTLIGSTDTAIGSGAQNTADILANCAEAGIAAKVADTYTLNGYDDWFIPSKDEWNSLSRLIYDEKLVGFDAGYYWSSTEHDAIAARVTFSPVPNTWSLGYKTDTKPVRAVRAF